MTKPKKKRPPWHRHVELQEVLGREGWKIVARDLIERCEKFDRYLRRTGQSNTRRRFKKVIDILP